MQVQINWNQNILTFILRLENMSPVFNMFLVSVSVFYLQAFLSNYLLETLHGCVQMYCQRYKISVKSIVGHAAPVP